MSDHVHFIDRCLVCDRVVRQCRCSSRDKVTSYVRCTTCEKKGPREVSSVAEVPFSIYVMAEGVTSAVGGRPGVSVSVSFFPGQEVATAKLLRELASKVEWAALPAPQSTETKEPK